MLFRFLLLPFIVLILCVSGAWADDYYKPSWADLTRSLVRFNAVKLSEPAILNDYTIITECDLYQAFYKDDFKWKQVQQAVTEAVKNHVATFPMSYYYDVALQLDRYDFANKIFRFTQKAGLHNINVIELYAVQATGCGDADVKSLPRLFRAVLSEPVSLDGLPLSEKDGQDLLQQMTAQGNPDRIVYARFNLRITYIEPLLPTAGDPLHYEQSSKNAKGVAVLDSRLDSIDFYKDEAHSRLIYHYQP